jgi:hypothetical protein
VKCVENIDEKVEKAVDVLEMLRYLLTRWQQ